MAASCTAPGTRFYEGFSQHFADALEYCINRVAPREGERVLDVATGTVRTARLAAAKDARVSGVDYSGEPLEAAREVAQQHGLSIAFDVGDAHAIPHPDGSFHAIVSTFGVILARDP